MDEFATVGEGSSPKVTFILPNLCDVRLTLSNGWRVGWRDAMVATGWRPTQHFAVATPSPSGSLESTINVVLEGHN